MTDASEPGPATPPDAEETSRLVERALVSLWAVANDLSQIRPPTHRYRVSIFGSARIQPGDPAYEDVFRLARRLTELGCDIVTGGGPGLMQAANEGAHEGDPDGRTESVGVRIALPFEQGANPFVETVYTHRTFFSRLHQFVRLSNAFVVVSGGIGTTLEALMVWQLLQVRHVGDVPLVFVGRMWTELTEWARRNMTEGPSGLADPEDVAIPACVDTAEEACDLLASHLAAFRAPPGGGGE